MNRKYPIISKAVLVRLIKLNDKGLSVKDIATKMNRSYYNIRKTLADNKIKSKYHFGKKVSPEDVQKICVYYDLQHWNITEICHVFKLTTSKVKRILEDHDACIRYKRRLYSVNPGRKIKAKYKMVEGEKVCAGLDYASYLKQSYGKDYKKYVPNNDAY